MSIVEGIGDEVIYVIGVTVILLIVLLAWYSTSVSDHPIFRASVLVIERRRTSPNNSQTNQSHRRVIITTTTTTSTSQQPTISNENVASGQWTSESEQNAPASVELLSNSANVEVNSSTISGSNEEKETQLRNRLKPAEVLGSQDIQVEQQLPTASETREVDVIADGKIRIRLVFLNDTQRLVEAKLDDRLGQFKQQHFSEELANHRVVRLIYNGQLLQGDQETLQFYGLFDNCVVHCHISSSTVVTPQPQHYSSHTSELDLSRLMLPLFGLILGLIWCCRMQYRQYFNATSTFALVGITGLFVVSVFSVCVTARNRIQSRG